MNWRRTIRTTSVLMAGSVAAAILTTGTANAEPNCRMTHDLRKISDNTGGNWLLELDLTCNSKAAVLSSEWTFTFWAEPQGGGPVTTYFTSEGKPYPESRKRPGNTHFVQFGAPLGFGRYCYQAQVAPEVPDPTRAPDPVYYTGTHCTDA